MLEQEDKFIPMAIAGTAASGIVGDAQRSARRHREVVRSLRREIQDKWT